MKIKPFLVFVLYVFLFSTLLFSTSHGADKYKKLPSPQLTRTGDKIEVLEFFWYGCSHCYQFEPVIEKWLEEKAEYIEFVRIPGALNKNWLPHARAFYAAKKLGVLDKIHRPLFDAIHKEKRGILGEKHLKHFFVEYGVLGEDFDKAYYSKDVQDDVRYAYSLALDYGLKGVPAIIVNGKYGTSTAMAGGYDGVIEVINSLAEEEYLLQNKDK